MERFREAAAFIGEQMGKLTASQRMLIASLVVMMLMTLFVVRQYTGEPPLAPLFPNATAEESARVETFLRASNIDYKVEGADIMVDPARHRWVQAQLAQQGALPADNTMYFEDMIAQQSWTKTTEQTRQMNTIARQNELALIISNMGGIDRASVIMDVPMRRALGAADKAPTASVTVFGAGVTQDTVDAVAHLVASSTAGLRIGNVRVIDGTTNRQYKARSDADFSASSYNEHVAKTEAMLRDKLLEMVSYIEGAIVTVHAQVDITHEVKSVTMAMPEDQGSVRLSRQSTASSMETSEAAEGGGPGVGANTGTSIPTGAATGSRSEQSEESSDYEVRIGMEERTIQDPKGHAVKISAVVNIPRGYFVRVYNESVGGGEEAEGDGADEEGAAGPSDEDIAGVRDAEIARIREEVRSLVDMSAKANGSVGDVLVSMIPVMPAALASGAGVGESAFLTASSGPMSMPNIVKNVSLGLLAIVSLAMVLYTTLRASRREPLPSAEEIVGVPPALEENSAILGEAGEADAALAGIELDDDELAVRKMRDQISSMVQERPQRAATLVGHWVADAE